MSAAQYGIIAAIVPAIVKRVMPLLGKKLKLAEFDAATKARIQSRAYPAHYGALYDLWVVAILLSGFAVMALFFALGFRSRENFARLVSLGLINMFGAWFFLGALLDALFWRFASEQLRDYVRLRQLQTGSGFSIEQQTQILPRLGALYYLVLSPLIIYLLWPWLN